MIIIARNISSLCIISILLSFSNLYSSSLVDILNESPLQDYLVDIELTEPQSGIELVDCIYVINLDERINRWNCLKNSWGKNGLSLNRVNAVNGWKLGEKVIEGITSPARKMKGGAVGCFLSHISVLKNAYENGFNIIWILEDDAEITDDPQKIAYLLENLHEIDPEWDILYTDVNNLGLTNGIEVFLPIQPKNLLNEHLMRARNRYGSHSILISKNGVEKLLKYFVSNLLMAPIDIEIHWIPDIRKYSVRENIVSHIEGADSTTEFPP